MTILSLRSYVISAEKKKIRNKQDESFSCCPPSFNGIQGTPAVRAARECRNGAGILVRSEEIPGISGKKCIGC